MLDRSTKEWVDEFIDQKYDDNNESVRPMLVRKEIDAYEEEIGKQLLEMNADEIMNLLMRYRTVFGNAVPINIGSANQVISAMRSLFKFYIGHPEGEKIENPMRDARFRYGNMAATITEAQKNSKLRRLRTYNELQNVIDKLYEPPRVQERAMYLECLCLMFYNGFYNATDVVSFTKDDIDWDNRIIRTNGRTIRVSHRCLELIKFVHNLEIMYNTEHGSRSVMISWHGSYFKFPVLHSFVDEYQERSQKRIIEPVAHYIRQTFRDEGIDANIKSIYLLGLYNRLVNEFGEERARQLIASKNNKDDTDTLRKALAKNGIEETVYSHTKRKLLNFIGDA